MRQTTKKKTSAPKTKKMYAAIGDDGSRPVVWGLGATEEKATADARNELRESGVRSDLTHVVAVTPKQATQIRQGVVSVEALGLTYGGRGVTVHRLRTK